MDERKVFSKNLNYLMEKSGKTQVDIITELGVNKSTISTWCNGVKMPRMGTIQTLADYFGVMKSDLIEDKGKYQQKAGDSTAVISSFSWSAPLVEAYASAIVSTQVNVCKILDIPHVISGEVEVEEEEYEDVPFYPEAPAAGYPNDASDYHELMSFPSRVVPSGTDFATCINGDSMEPKYPNGSIVFVRNSNEIGNNYVGVFRLEDGFVCKRARVNEMGRIKALMSDNPKYKDLVGSDLRGLEIVGVVLGCWIEE